MAEIRALTGGVLAGMGADFGYCQLYVAGQFLGDGQWLWACALGLTGYSQLGLAFAAGLRVFRAG